MAKFFYDVSNAPPLFKDFPLINDTYVDGEFLCAGVTDGTNLGSLLSGEGVYVDFAGIKAGALTTEGTLANRNIDEGEVIYNPFGVYLCEYYKPADAITISTIKNVSEALPLPSFACDSSDGQPNCGGGWMYRTTDPGKGELDFITSALVSGSITQITPSQACSTAFTTSSKMIIIYPPFGDYSIDMTDDQIDGTDIDAGGGTEGTDGMAVAIMDNWIQWKGRNLQRLRAATHEHLINLDNLDVQFYSEVCFARSHFLVS